jgi:hypothetical protein
VYSTTPEIGVVSISPSTVKEFQDQVTIVISYQDGDGDLGENNPDVSNLFLTDNRIGVTYEYRIPQLSPDNSDLIIKGNLNVVLKNTGITNGASSQTVNYSLYVVDRAGNKSNTVTTSDVMVVK